MLAATVRVTRDLDLDLAEDAVQEATSKADLRRRLGRHEEAGEADRAAPALIERDALSRRWEGLR